MSQQEFLCLHSSCVALKLLVAIGNSLPSCFICRERITFVTTEIVLLLVVNSDAMSQQDFLCCDRSSSLSWLNVENFVAT